MKGLTRKNIKTVIICSWILAYIPLLPSLFEIYGIHGLECQTRQCKILPIGSKGVSVKRYFEIVLHVFWAIVLVAANIGILIQYWVSALIKDNFFILSTENESCSWARLDWHFLSNSFQGQHQKTHSLRRPESIADVAFGYSHNQSVAFSVNQSFFIERNNTPHKLRRHINTRSKQDQKVTSVVVTVVAVFFLTYLPLFVVRTVRIMNFVRC